ncbi:MAG: response regulator transcription factor [Vreelandella alkaliphila]|uniref:LuxR family transcriptional regulator n=2 Tax=Halomonadaceae TaxID=28256 RepID=A0A3D0KFI5_9GAMM|nr:MULTISPECIES: LuxR C-terminal-related transcriptional regulator [unclassified Halomonas]HBS84737.1 LuxR family transcriptional regulator [Halomonas campaniensis]HCA02060.1 LuxR family transcriptional regulator [Halomonas campaniensis]
MANDSSVHSQEITFSNELINQALAGAISTLRTIHFTSHFTKLLRTLVTFDCTVIVGYRPAKHPIYLFDSLPEQRELLFQRYLMDAYQEDPFLLLLAQQQEQGVFSIEDTSLFKRVSDTYQQGFNQQTGWQDEVCIILQLGGEDWLVIYLGKLSGPETQHTGFTCADRARLTGYLGVLSALCKQHWQVPFHLASTTVNSDIAATLRQSVESFGKALLTPREQQVAALMVQGMDSQEIAEYLAIGLGTVKNHRKRIYAQLGVTSLSELFGLFLNHIVAASARPDYR